MKIATGDNAVSATRIGRIVTKALFPQQLDCSLLNDAIRIGV